MFAAITREPRARNTQFNSLSLERTKPIPMTPDKEGITADWRELARRIQQETDPETVLELARALIAKFNEEKLRRNLRPDEK